MRTFVLSWCIDALKANPALFLSISLKGRRFLANIICAPPVKQIAGMEWKKWLAKFQILHCAIMTACEPSGVDKLIDWLCASVFLKKKKKEWMISLVKGSKSFAYTKSWKFTFWLHLFYDDSYHIWERRVYCSGNIPCISANLLILTCCKLLVCQTSNQTKRKK